MSLAHASGVAVVIVRSSAGAAGAFARGPGRVCQPHGVLACKKGIVQSWLLRAALTRLAVTTEQPEDKTGIWARFGIDRPRLGNVRVHPCWPCPRPNWFLSGLGFRVYGGVTCVRGKRLLRPFERLALFCTYWPLDERF